MKTKQQPQSTVVPLTAEIVHTLVPTWHQGFPNYRVATFELKDGQVVKVEYSDPYAGFEAAAHLEIKNSRLLEKLRKSYPTKPEAKR